MTKQEALERLFFVLRDAAAARHAFGMSQTDINKNRTQDKEALRVIEKADAELATEKKDSERLFIESGAYKVRAETAEARIKELEHERKI